MNSIISFTAIFFVVTVVVTLLKIMLQQPLFQIGGTDVSLAIPFVMGLSAGLMAYMEPQPSKGKGEDEDSEFAAVAPSEEPHAGSAEKDAEEENAEAAVDADADADANNSVDDEIPLTDNCPAVEFQFRQQQAMAALVANQAFSAPPVATMAGPLEPPQQPTDIFDEEDVTWGTEDVVLPEPPSPSHQEVAEEEDEPPIPTEAAASDGWDFGEVWTPPETYPVIEDVC